MQALRAEVHSFNSDNKVIKDEVAALRAQVVELKTIREFPLLPDTGDTSTSKQQLVEDGSFVKKAITHRDGTESPS